jgi:23S rRNA pseudouridine955/2504/2580 synthase
MAYEHIVSNEENGLRADRIVSNLDKRLGYVFLQKVFRLNKVKVNNKKIKASDRLYSGDVIKIYSDVSLQDDVISPEYNQKLVNQFLKMIIFENDDFIVINKPTNLAVQAGTKISICVETFMKSYQVYKKCECKLVHRIDKDTSGILLIAKNREVAARIAKLFKENKIRKTYIAVVDGKIKTSGVINNFLEKSTVGTDEKVRISEKGQLAITKYRSLDIIDDLEKDFNYYTLLELTPLTGRTHQLRVHCADVLKSPILGDKKYNKCPIHKKLFLHAYKMIVDEIKIICPIPDYFPKSNGYL